MEEDNKNMCKKLWEGASVFIDVQKSMTGAIATCIDASTEWIMHAPLHVAH